MVERMPATLQLGITSLIVSLLIGVPLGVISAVYRGSWVDNLIRFFSVVFRSVPVYWMGGWAGSPREAGRPYGSI